MPTAAPDAPWSVGAVAAQLGVAPATLRTWERRYGLGPSLRDRGAHRRYSPDDIAKLRAMTDLLRQGLSARDAAVAAQSTTKLARSIRHAPRPRETADADRRWRRGVMRAAEALDVRTVIQQVSAALEQRGVQLTWDELLRPVLIEAGLKFQTTGQGVDMEHLLSDGIVTALAGFAAAQPSPRTDLRPALLACLPEELHQLPLHSLRAALAEQRLPVRLLGAATPVGALQAAIRRTSPSSVVLWSQISTTANAELFDQLPTMRPTPAIFTSGVGWADVTLPAHVTHLTSLLDAMVALPAAAGVATAR